MKRLRDQNGFTITELLIVMAMMGILIGIAAMSIGGYQRRNAIKEAARSIDGDLMQIRTAARTQQLDILVQFTSDLAYTACVDINGIPGCQIPGDTLILNRTFNKGLVRYQRDAFSFPNELIFNRIGNVADNTPSDFVVRYESEPNRMYCVQLFPTGITRVQFTEVGAPPCNTPGWGTVW